jgi:hypothetical protein
MTKREEVQVVIKRHVEDQYALALSVIDTC